METEIDVLIVGAGLSGIGAAYRLQELCPDREYLILEGRESIGGTWDLFRYPGIRSDSDMYTLGYPFKPWTGQKSIADGADILAYIKETATENGIDSHIRFNHKVQAASWSSETSVWTVKALHNGDSEVTYRAKFVFFCSGYYSYDAGYTPEFEGRADFEGQVIHPQQWDANLDYTDQEVVVIGSGATAVTLVPSLAAKAKHVTMLQRSPTYITSLPAIDPIGSAVRKVLPASMAHSANRWRSVLLTGAFYQFCRRRPDLARKLLRKGVQRLVPDEVDVDVHFNPRYDPWDQRLCLVPNGDLFKVMRKGKASVVTDTIDRFTTDGIKLNSGAELKADIVVTATGLVLVPCGGVSIEVDGEEVKPSDHYVYQGFMLSGIPNVAMCVGYTNASWTLRSDITARSVCTILNDMTDRRADVAVPELNPGETIEDAALLPLSSGYVQRSVDLLPKQGAKAPWQIRQNFILDLLSFKFGGPSQSVKFKRSDPATSKLVEV